MPGASRSQVLHKPRHIFISLERFQRCLVGGLRTGGSLGRETKTWNVEVKASLHPIGAENIGRALLAKPCTTWWARYGEETRANGKRSTRNTGVAKKAPPGRESVGVIRIARESMSMDLTSSCLFTCLLTRPPALREYARRLTMMPGGCCMDGKCRSRGRLPSPPETRKPHNRWYE